MKNSNCNVYTGRAFCGREYICEDTVLLNTKANYIFTQGVAQQAQYAINNYVNKAVSEFNRRNRDVLQKEAKAGYCFALENGYPFNQYEAQVDFNPSYNNNNLYSFYYDTYEYSGGAHGITVRRSKTFNSCNGRDVDLCSLFERRGCFEQVLDYITALAEEMYNKDRGIFFENYKELIEQNLRLDSFYLSDDGINIYFQQYEIAPYSTGIVVFTIPYNATPYSFY